MTYSSSSFQDEAPTFDRAVVIGAIVLCASLGLGILSSTNIFQFVDIRSLLLVTGGTFAATLINFSFTDLVHASNTVRRAMGPTYDATPERIAQLIKLSSMVKTGGILALEGITRRVQDPFFRRALELAVDGEKQPELERTLVHECLVTEERAKRAAQVFEAAGSYAPGLGLIGTLFGLVEMLGTIGTGQALGSSMALALLTTLYGALLSNLICLPLAGKIRLRGESEAQLKRITLEGVRLIQALENPMAVEQKLKAFAA